MWFLKDLLKLYLWCILKILSTVTRANDCKISKDDISDIVKPLFGYLLISLVPVDVICNIY